MLNEVQLFGASVIARPCGRLILFLSGNVHELKKQLMESDSFVRIMMNVDTYNNGIRVNTLSVFAQSLIPSEPENDESPLIGGDLRPIGRTTFINIEMAEYINRIFTIQGVIDVYIAPKEVEIDLGQTISFKNKKSSSNIPGVPGIPSGLSKSNKTEPDPSSLSGTDSPFIEAEVDEDDIAAAAISPRHPGANADDNNRKSRIAREKERKRRGLPFGENGEGGEDNDDDEDSASDADLDELIKPRSASNIPIAGKADHLKLLACYDSGPEDDFAVKVAFGEIDDLAGVAEYARSLE